MLEKGIEQRNLAIIPARSGSKSVKNKNIRKFNGKPLMAYTITAALNCGLFEEVMVSTDSEEYAKIAEEYGATVPFMRSRTTSTDIASSWDMVQEVLDGYEKQDRTFDSFCLLQPTSPLRTSDDISKAYQLFTDKADVAVVSVCEMEHSPLWSGKLTDDKSLDGFITRASMGNRQQNGKYYRLNGAIYIISVKAFKEDSFFYRKGSYAYIMSQIKSVDIDTEVDFRIAEDLAKWGGIG